MSQNQYVQLAARSLVNLCDLAAELEGTQPLDPPCHFVAEALREAHYLWQRLSWSDGALNDHERAILDVIVQHAIVRGYEQVTTKLFEREAKERTIPEFLRVACLSDGLGPRLVGRMINHIESFGYGVLASDREIHEVELTNLKDYIAWLRDEVQETRDGNAAYAVGPCA